MSPVKLMLLARLATDGTQQRYRTYPVRATSRHPRRVKQPGNKRKGSCRVFADGEDLEMYEAARVRGFLRVLVIIVLIQGDPPGTIYSL